MRILGQNDHGLIFSEDGVNGVVVTESNVVKSGIVNVQAITASADFSTEVPIVDESTIELAEAALSNLDISITASAGRLYTVPSNVQNEVAYAYKLVAAGLYKPTPMDSLTASALAGGDQVSLQQVTNVAKYFSQHSDRNSDNIAWRMWGGDAARKWSLSVIRRVNDKAILADGYVTNDYVSTGANYSPSTPYSADLSPFAGNDDTLEFIARVRMDGSGIDRLYKIDTKYNVTVWDDGFWHDIPGVDSDLSAYDEYLDRGMPSTECSHVEIDPESAMFISACLQEDPHAPVAIVDVNPEEAQMVLNAAPGIDLEFLDTIVADGSPAAAPQAPAAGDGQYTPQERSQNVSKQVRDATGKFAKMGSRVVVAGDFQKGAGSVIGMNPKTQNVRIKLDNGIIVDVQGNQIQPEEQVNKQGITQPNDPAPLDVSGILGEPRVPIDQAGAKIPGTLPALTQQEVAKMMYDFPAAVDAQRKAFYESLKTPAKKVPLAAQIQKLTGVKITHDPYKDPKYKRIKTATPDLVPPAITAAATVDKKGDAPLTPETSDVQPMFFAIVAQDDPSAVLSLVALIPASKNSNEPATYVRKDKKWVSDPKTAAELKSATPPPVVPLTAEALVSVVSQVDGITPVLASVAYPDEAITLLWSRTGNIMVMTAAGESLRSKLKGHLNGAEHLKKYWTVGKGGMKIRWNTPGDWTRCNRYLRKYLGPRAKSYCALRHHEMTGMWTGDKEHLKRDGKRGGLRNFSANTVLSREEIDAAFALSRKAESARRRVLVAAVETPAEGARFRIPLVIPEVAESGDGRRFEKGAITIRELPLPLMWQIKTEDGHNGSVVVGRIDTMERIEGGIGNAYGVFDTSPNGREAERLVRNGFITGVSADLDQFEASEEPGALSQDGTKDSSKIGTDKLLIHKARVMGTTIVPKPAFQQCKIYIVENETPKEEQVIQDGIHVDEVDPVEATALVACGLVAGVIPVVPPRNWFSNPDLKQPTPLTVDDEGRVFGHIAAWHVDHIGLSQGTRPPRSRSKYAYFHTGVVRTDDGTDIPVGQLTLAGGHASMSANAAQAARHYDDTGSAVADVHAGEDAFGIWVSGALRPGTQPEQIRALRASAPSGDWRPIGRNLELVAVCQVNVPGFPIARARVASGAIMALVAAGAATLAKMKSDPLAELNSRIDKLEQFENQKLATLANAARERLAPALEQKNLALSNAADAAYERLHGKAKYEDGFGFISREKRQSLARSGHALPDGSFPIANEDDLKQAVSAYGRASAGKRGAVRHHIMKRARDMKRTDLIPEKWKKVSSLAVEADSADLRTRLATFAANAQLPLAPPAPQAPFVEGDSLGKAPAVESYVPGKYTPETQPRDKNGKFREVLARLRSDLGPDSSQEAIAQIKQAEAFIDAGDYDRAVESAKGLVNTVEKIDIGTMNPEARGSIQQSTRELGKLVANLPLPTGSDTEHLNYSDMPPVMKTMIDDMLDRAARKISQPGIEKMVGELKDFMRGAVTFTQPELSSELNKLLVLLT